MNAAVGLTGLKITVEQVLKGIKKYSSSVSFQKKLDDFVNKIFHEYQMNGKYSIIDDISQDDLLSDTIKLLIKEGYYKNKYYEESQELKELPKDRNIYFVEFVNKIIYGIKEIIIKQSSPEIQILADKMDSIMLKLEESEPRDNSHLVFEFNDIIEETLKMNSIRVTMPNNSLFNIDESILVLKEEIWIDIKKMFEEIIDNASKHGNAKNISLSISSLRFTIIDDGEEFDITKELNSLDSYTGGKFTYNYVVNNYKDTFSISYIRDKDKNYYIFDFKIKAFNVEEVCSISVAAKSYRRQDIEVVYPDIDSDCYIWEPKTFYNISLMSNIVGSIEMSNKDMKPIIVTLEDEMSKEFFRKKSVRSKIYFRYLK